MNFDLTEEQTLLQTLMEKYVGDRYDPVKRLRYVQEQNGFSAEGWKILADNGVLGLMVEEDAGGFGGGSVELVVVMEALGKGVVTEPLLSAVVLAGGLLERAGTAAQKETWLPRLMAGEAFAALAHIEPAARYNLEHVETRAVRHHDTVRLSGHKRLVLSGPFADILLVSARDEDGRTGLYLVARESDGLVMRPYRLMDGAAACDIDLASVAAAPMEGGIEDIKAALAPARLAIAAELVGLTDLMFNATLDYVKTRRQFGAPLGSFQTVQHRMAENYRRLELSRSQLYRVLTFAEDAPERVAALAGAKAFISENAIKVGEEAIQLHGGIGMTEELMVGQAFKRAFLLANLFGDSQDEVAAYIRHNGVCR
jgi:alkylation response protein AidB-like acyl-CoA dehydrogenase